MIAKKFVALLLRWDCVPAVDTVPLPPMQTK